MIQWPSVGRIVHYHSYGTPGGEYKSEPRAAIISEVVLGTLTREAYEFVGDYPEVGLAVLNPTGMFFNQNVPFSPDPKPGHWSWPPRA